MSAGSFASGTGNSLCSLCAEGSFQRHAGSTSCITCGAGFLCLAGQPIREPICWHGPFVMNTRAEIQQCMREYQNGTFIKHKAAARRL